MKPRRSRAMFDLSLVLPCYNEVPVFSESVRSITHTLEQSRLTWEIIFVDDASSDGTQDLIRKTIRKTAHCRAVFHPHNMGRGRAVADGIVSARGRAVGFIDIDCEVSPVYIPQLASSVLDGSADVILGNRIYRSSVTGLAREAISVGYRKIADVLIGTGGLDTESGYKFFNREKILKLLPTVHDPGWFWDTEIVVRSLQAGMRVRQIPVLFLRRTDKRSSVRIFRDTYRYLKNLVRFSSELH